MKTKSKKYFISMPSMYLLGMLIFFGCGGSNDQETTEAPKDFVWTTASEQALADFEKGLLLQEAGDASASREAMTSAIEKDPNFAMAYAFRSYTSGSGKEFAEDNNKALSLVENVTEPEKIMIQINQTYLKGENNKRVELFKSLTDMLPESARALTYRAQDYSGRDETEVARNHYEKAIGLDPNFLGAYVSSGLSHMNSAPKDFNKALQRFEKAASLSPDIAYLYVHVGDANRALDDLEASAAGYEKALSMDPESYSAMLKRGHVNSFLGNYEAARKDYEATLGYNDAGSQGFLYSAFTHLYNNDVDAAVAELEESLTKVGDLGLSPSRERSATASIVNSLVWIAFHHDKPALYDQYLSMRNELDMKGAEEVGTDEALKDSKARAAIFNGMGEILKDNFDAATAAAEEYNTMMATDESPNKMYFSNLMMGLNHYHQGNFEEAIASLEKSNPDNLYRNYVLAKAHMAAGNEDGAMAMMEKIAIDNFNSVFYALIRNETKEIANSAS